MSNIRLKILSSFLLIFSIFVFSCKKNNSHIPNSNEKILIVTSTFPCYDAVRALVGKNDKIDLKLLVKPGSEVHSFDPSPQNIIDIQKSHLFVYIGGESDEWIEKIIGNKENANNTTLRLIDFVETEEEIEFSDATDFSTIARKPVVSLSNHDFDEHIWTNPENEIKIIDAVSVAVCKVVSENEQDDILQNAENYKNAIREVDAEISEIVFAAKEKYFVMADRFPFVYFAKYYGLDFDAAFSGCSSAVEASAKTVFRLVNNVKEKQLPAVFYIELSNHKLADEIAKTCDVASLCLQSVQNVTKNDFENGETWVSLMKRNAENLRKGLN